MIFANNPSGKDVKPVQALKVPKNIASSPFVIFANNPDGIDVRPVQVLNVPENISATPVVICENKFSEIDVKLVHPKNVLVKLGFVEAPVMAEVSVGNTADKSPDTDATDVLDAVEKDIAAVCAFVLYPVATPEKAMVFVPAVE